MFEQAVWRVEESEREKWPLDEYRWDFLEIKSGQNQLLTTPLSLQGDFPGSENRAAILNTESTFSTFSADQYYWSSSLLFDTKESWNSRLEFRKF